MSKPIRLTAYLLTAGVITVSSTSSLADGMQQGYGGTGQTVNSSGQLQNFTRSPHPQYRSDTYFLESGAKFTNGIANLATAPIEIPKNIINTTNESNLIYGIVGGLLKGVVNIGGRVLVGITDIVTFPIPTKPIAQPLYVWDNFDSDTSYGQIFQIQKTDEQP